jgi:hypothetical protein
MAINNSAAFQQKRVGIQVDRNLVLCLPRMAVLVRIDADRPGAWFTGSLGSDKTWFPAI